MYKLKKNSYWAETSSCKVLRGSLILPNLAWWTCFHLTELAFIMADVALCFFPLALCLVCTGLQWLINQHYSISIVFNAPGLRPNHQILAFSEVDDAFHFLSSAILSLVSLENFPMHESFSLLFWPRTILYDSFLSTLITTDHCNFELAFPAFCPCFSGFPFRIPYNFSMLAFELCFFLTLFLQ